MRTRVLGPEEIERFMDSGYATVRQAFTARQAAAACECVWRRMEQKAGIRRSDPSTWPERYDIAEHLRNAEVLECFTDRLADAIGQLVGEHNWRGERRWGFWPVNFSFGRSRPYDFPATSWHIDGNWFRHTVDSPKQGLLVIGLFTDVEPRGGGTILSLGSHKRTARVLAAHPEGMDHRDLFREVLSVPIGDFYEVTGSAGDVVLAHPFLFHTKGMKHRGAPRIISNTEAGLRRPMTLAGAPGDEYTILEQSIRRALREEPAVPSDARSCRF
ncbi:phytanoyl-CoA dioxygenase family protein [Streptosporangiaceae bacterium NEAU-GS5]|nr:phytanoyl-CoA dioxygenase family protein [Streptosporangiaceae bacterium NEAU-GS5]